MSPLEQMNHAILDEIDDIKATTERFDLCEQPGAAESMPRILEHAKALAEEINDLCSTEHLPPSTLALGIVPPADAEPEHAQ